MSKITTQFTMSLDGFIAGLNDDISRLFGWYGTGDETFALPGTDRPFRVWKASAEYLQQEWSTLGAIVTGRHDFEVSNAYGGVSPLGIPMYIVTHRATEPEWVKPGLPFTFVMEGVEPAIALARQAAGNKNVGISGTSIVQQCLRVNLLDEILIDLAPILLGAGTRLFDELGGAPIELEKISVIDTPSVTHLKYRVKKPMN